MEVVCSWCMQYIWVKQNFFQRKHKCEYYLVSLKLTFKNFFQLLVPWVCKFFFKTKMKSNSSLVFCMESRFWIYQGWKSRFYTLSWWQHWANSWLFYLQSKNSSTYLLGLFYKLLRDMKDRCNTFKIWE